MTTSDIPIPPPVESTVDSSVPELFAEKSPTCVVQVTNIAPQCTQEQLETFFSYIGKVEDLKLYPTMVNTNVIPTPKICYVKFSVTSKEPYCEALLISQHLANTVFLDRSLCITPLALSSLPDERSGMTLGSQRTSSVAPAALMNGASLRVMVRMPKNIITRIEGGGASAAFVTIDHNLVANGLPPYPPLPIITPADRIEEIRRTVCLAGFSPDTTAQEVIDALRPHTGEISFVRFCNSFPTLNQPPPTPQPTNPYGGSGVDQSTHSATPVKYALVEFTQHASVILALKMNNMVIGDRVIKFNHAVLPIFKPNNPSSMIDGPTSASSGTTSSIATAMTGLLSAADKIALDGGVGIKRSRSRSRSRHRHRSSRRHHRSRSRSRSHRRRRRSRSRSKHRRRRSRSRESRRRRRRSRSSSRHERGRSPSSRGSKRVSSRHRADDENEDERRSRKSRRKSRSDSRELSKHENEIKNNTSLDEARVIRENGVDSDKGSPEKNGIKSRQSSPAGSRSPSVTRKSRSKSPPSSRKSVGPEHRRGSPASTVSSTNKSSNRHDKQRQDTSKSRSPSVLVSPDRNGKSRSKSPPPLSDHVKKRRRRRNRSGSVDDEEEEEDSRRHRRRKSRSGSISNSSRRRRRPRDKSSRSRSVDRDRRGRKEERLRERSPRQSPERRKRRSSPKRSRKSRSIDSPKRSSRKSRKQSRSPSSDDSGVRKSSIDRSIDTNGTDKKKLKRAIEIDDNMEISD